MELESNLESLYEIVKRQKEIAKKMCSELESQNKLISKITTTVDKKEIMIKDVIKSIPLNRTWYEWLKSWF